MGRQIQASQVLYRFQGLRQEAGNQLSVALALISAGEALAVYQSAEFVEGHIEIVIDY